MAIKKSTTRHKNKTRNNPQIKNHKKSCELRLNRPQTWHKIPDHMYNRTPLTRMLVIRTANYPDRFGTSGKFVENSTKLTCLEITSYQIKCRTVLWVLGVPIRCDQKFRSSYVP
jgi:hypothetical protein